MLRIINVFPKLSVVPEQKYVPLKEVSIESKIHSFAADVTIKQIFRNDESTPIEAVYCFPIEEQAAIYRFIAQIDDRQIEGQLKEKSVAQKEYSDALQQGHGAYLLEQDEKSQDNFIINVGALPPGKECHITISYVIELDLVDNGRKIRFLLPTTIAPRYNPSKGGISAPGETNASYVQSTPYTVQFQCQIEKTNVSSVSSSSHPIQIDFSQPNYHLVKFGQDNTHLDRDILLDIHLTEQRSNTILAMQSNVLMVSFTPNEADCQRSMDDTDVNNEFLFVVDCSGSMRDENKIDYARQSMLLFLKSLPLNSHFNIIRFGSSYEALFKEATVIYDENNSKQAEEMIKKMEADLGGTELLHPLQWLEEHPPKEGRSRQIFLLTDGEISNVDEVLNLCRSMSKSSRIFSFGLGQSPSRALVKGLARATNGRFCFIPPSTKVDTYVGQQLEKALQPSITNVQIKWNLPTEITTAPVSIPPVYANDRLIIYGLINDASFVFNHDVKIELFNAKHKLGEANINRIPQMVSNEAISRLAGKALILELQHSKLPSTIRKGSTQARFQIHSQQTNESVNEKKDEVKKRIIDLSLKYQILSPYTSFVGIEKRSDGNNDNMVLREVPIQISADDQHLQRPLPNASIRSMSMTLGSSMQSCMSVPPPMVYTSAILNCRVMPQMMLSTPNALPPQKRGRTEVQSSAMFDRCDNGSRRASAKVNKAESKEVAFPTDDEDIVRYLIDQQNFDGLWSLNSTIIEKLTGKSLDQFQQSIKEEILVSAIIITLLERRFSSFSSMCHGIVQKGRKRLFDLLGKDTNKLQTLFDDIRKQL